MIQGLAAVTQDPLDDILGRMRGSASVAMVETGVNGYAWVCVTKDDGHFGMWNSRGKNPPLAGRKLLAPLPP